MKGSEHWPRQLAPRYGRALRAEHRVIAVAHHEQPSYRRRMLTRLFR